MRFARCYCLVQWLKPEKPKIFVSANTLSMCRGSAPIFCVLRLKSFDVLQRKGQIQGRGALTTSLASLRCTESKPHPQASLEGMQLFMAGENTQSVQLSSSLFASPTLWPKS